MKEVSEGGGVVWVREENLVRHVARGGQWQRIHAVLRLGVAIQWAGRLE